MLTKEMLREAREQLDVLEKGLDGAEVEWTYHDLQGGWRELPTTIRDGSLGLDRYRYRLKPKPPLVFEVGKSYRRRDGKKAVVVEVEPDALWHCHKESDLSWVSTYAYHNGRQYRDTSMESDLDLIDYWTE